MPVLKNDSHGSVQSKIGKLQPFSINARMSAPARSFSGKVIKHCIRPCATDHFQIFEFCHKCCDRLLWIPAVTQEDNLPAGRKPCHDRTDHVRGRFQFGKFFRPQPVTRRYGKIPAPAWKPSAGKGFPRLAVWHLENKFQKNQKSLQKVWFLL